MKKIKLIGYSLLINISILLILLLITTLLSYINIINNKTLSIILLIIPILSTFISNLYIGKNSIKKGYIEGIKNGVIFIFILLLLNISLYRVFTLKLIIYYLIFIISAILGSMIGINIKRKS